MKDNYLKNLNMKGFRFYESECDDLGKIISIDFKSKRWKYIDNVKIYTKFIILEDDEYFEDEEGTEVYVEHTYEIDTVSEYRGVLDRIVMLEHIMIDEVQSQHFDAFHFYFEDINVSFTYKDEWKKMSIVDFYDFLYKGINRDVMLPKAILLNSNKEIERTYIDTIPDIEELDGNKYLLLDIEHRRSMGIYFEKKVSKLNKLEEMKLERYIYNEGCVTDVELDYKYLDPKSKEDCQSYNPQYLISDDSIKIAREMARFYFESKQYERYLPQLNDDEVVSTLKVKLKNGKIKEFISGTFEFDDIDDYSPNCPPNKRKLYVEI